MTGPTSNGPEDRSHDGARHLIDALGRLIGPAHVRTGPTDTARHTTPFRGTPGRAVAVALPADAEETLAVVQLALDHELRVLPQGANTGLVGASVPDDSGTWLVICTDRMNTIEVAGDGDIAVCGAGVRLSALNAALAPSGRWLPIDVGGDPSVGGMASTNAGGARMVRYGDTASRTIDLEGVVTAPDLMRISFGPLVHKNAVPRPGRDLLVGGNGQFGLITAIALATASLRTVVQTGWAIVDSAAEAEQLVAAVLDSGLQVDAVEVMASTCIEAVRKMQPTMRVPHEPGAYHLLIELSLSLPSLPPAGTESQPSTSLTDSDRLSMALASVVSKAVPEARLLAIEPAHAWTIRHAISDAIRHRGVVIGCDIGLPRHRLSTYVDEVRSWLALNAPEAMLCDFGHWADGGVHANVVIPANHATKGGLSAERIRTEINARAAEFGGTFSAEHGLGPTNADAWRLHANEGERSLFRLLKATFDPRDMWGWPLLQTN